MHFSCIVQITSRKKSNTSCILLAKLSFNTKYCSASGKNRLLADSNSWNQIAVELKEVLPDLSKVQVDDSKSSK
jgi:hypothetical protein